MKIFFALIFGLMTLHAAPSFAGELSSVQIEMFCPTAQHVRIEEDGEISYYVQPSERTRTRRCVQMAIREIQSSPYPVNMGGIRGTIPGSAVVLPNGKIRLQ